MRSTLAIVVIMQVPDLRLQKLSSMDFFGLQLMLTQNRLFASVMDARDMQDSTMCRLKSFG